MLRSVRSVLLGLTCSCWMALARTSGRIAVSRLPEKGVGTRRSSGAPAGNPGSRDRIGNDGAGQRQIARAERSEVGALHQAGFDIQRVVEDAAAAANHGAVVGQAPGETGGGSKAQVGVLFVAEADLRRRWARDTAAW